MSFKASWLSSLRLACRVLAAVAITWASAAQAQPTVSHSISGSAAQFYIGNGLPIPIPGGNTPAFSCPNSPFKPPAMTGPPFSPPGRPFCGGFAVTGSVVGPFPPGTAPSMMIPAGVITQPATNITKGLNPFNTRAFFIRTNFSWQWPLSDATFEANGRSGPPTVTWCVGQTATVLGGSNPMCAGPGAGLINGLMRYRKVTNQFGGPAPGLLAGTGDLGVVVVPFNPPTTPTGQLAVIPLTPGPLVPIGGQFGTYQLSNPPTGKVYLVFGTTGDGIPTATFGPVASGITNVGTSVGAPWTTGMLTVINTNTAGAASERFTLTGSDGRVDGVGNITLVTGGIGFRNTTLGNANRGIVTFVVPEPAAAVSAAGALLMLLTCHRLARRRSR